MRPERTTALRVVAAVLAGGVVLQGAAAGPRQGLPAGLRETAEGGDPAAQMQLGYRLEEGVGVERDAALALEWYRRAAAQGLADAQYQVGLMYELGIGVEADMGEAEIWYRRAIDQGYCPGELQDPSAYEHRPR